jgi:RNA polymerase sigma-B factor
VSESELLESRRADVVFHVYSLDAPLSEREDSNDLADVLGTEDAEVEHTVDMEAVTAHWGELPPREQRILLLRFYGNLTQAEIGERLGISQMHVSRLLARALGFLRNRLAGGDELEWPEAVPDGVRAAAHRQ